MGNRDYKSIRRLYVSQLDSDFQSLIKYALTKFYKEELELEGDEIKHELDLALNSRVSDLEATINVKKILQQL